jgi:hypothetical protein
VVKGQGQGERDKCSRKISVRQLLLFTSIQSEKEKCPYSTTSNMKKQEMYAQHASVRKDVSVWPLESQGLAGKGDKWLVK